MKVLIIWALLITSSIYAGNERGNGGDACEDNFISVRNDLLSWIQKNGHKQLILNSDTSFKRYKDGILTGIIEAKVACTSELLHIGSAEKTCINFIDNETPRIKCNFSRFQSLSEEERYRLVHHEYAGLAGLEVNSGEESNYTISNQLTSFLEDKKIKRLAIKSNGSSSQIVPGLTGPTSCKFTFHTDGLKAQEFTLTGNNRGMYRYLSVKVGEQVDPVKELEVRVVVYRNYTYNPRNPFPEIHGKIRYARMEIEGNNLYNETILSFNNSDQEALKGVNLELRNHSNFFAYLRCEAQ